MSSKFGHYTHAIVCRLPTTFVSAIGTTEAINLSEARREQTEYIMILRSLGLDVIELPPDESLPDCPFVEDTAIICDGIALICKPGHPNRVKEVETIRAIIKKELNLPLIEIADPNATIDGGDVLFTGREFFVGLSIRTNEAGARAVAAAFPEYPVTPIKVPPSLIHLKAALTMAGPDIICVSSAPQAQEMLRRVEREATFKYNKLTVPDTEAANVLYVNGTLVYRSVYPNSNDVFHQKVDYPKVPIKAWELLKPDASLTCLSLLVNKSRSAKRFINQNYSNKY